MSGSGQHSQQELEGMSTDHRNWNSPTKIGIFCYDYGIIRVVLTAYQEIKDSHRSNNGKESNAHEAYESLKNNIMWPPHTISLLEPVHFQCWLVVEIHGWKHKESAGCGEHTHA